MGPWRAATLVKHPPGFDTTFHDGLHDPLRRELPAGFADITVVDQTHPLWAALSTMGSRRSMRLDCLPEPMRVELVWWAWRCTLNGSSVNGAVVWWLQRHWPQVAAACSRDGQAPPVSFLERPHAVWVAACRKVRLAEGAPLARQNTDACTSALLARICHSLNVTCLPLEWWEHDLWAPGLDPRVPIRRVEPTGHTTISFAAIDQPWLRSAARWYLRVGLETNAFGWSSAHRKVEGLRRLGKFLSAKGIDDPVLVADPEQDLAVLAGEFLSWLLTQDNRLGPTLSRSFCRDMQCVIGSFYLFMFDHRVEAARALAEPRWRQLSPFHPSVLAQAHRIRIPRLPEQILALDDDVLAAVAAHVDILGLAKDQTRPVVVDGVENDVAGIGDPQAMRIYLLLILLGRRASEILLLDRDPLVPIAGIDPQAAGPGEFVARLHYAQTKIEGAPDTIPVEAEVVNIVREQQGWLDERFGPAGTSAAARWLFVRHHQNRLGTAPYTYSTLIRRLVALAAQLGLRDSQGHPIKLTRTHALRHTKATGLINAGVPLAVVQRYMGHLSPVMTSHYAQLRDHTIQEAFLTMAKRRADGTPSPVAAGDLFDLLQLDRRTDRILPNGWCLLPPRQVCEKGNACFTCDMFVTDGSHLDVIERQRAANQQLIEQRRADFLARHGEPMSDTHVWLEPRLREARALDLLITALQADHGQAVRGAGVPARLAGDSPVILGPTRRPETK
jgi:integrase